MKLKNLLFLLAIAIVFAITACGGNDDDSPQTTQAPPQSTPPSTDPDAGRLFTSSRGIVMSWIPAGTFTMGSDDADDWGSQPPHNVTLTQGFYMGRYEVTQELFQFVMERNPGLFTSSSPAAGEVQIKRPVVNISWFDAIEFCNKLSEFENLEPVYELTGITRNPSQNITAATVEADFTKNGYRLPTEAQWEYACRAGTTTLYSYGDTPNGDYMWYYYNSNNMTREVGKKLPNAWNLYDMLGNVWEWVWDWYDYYPNTAQTDPTGPALGTHRVERGGGYDHDEESVRSASRNNFSPDNFRANLGFRVIRP